MLPEGLFSVGGNREGGGKVTLVGGGSQVRGGVTSNHQIGMRDQPPDTSNVVSSQVAAIRR